MIYFQAKSDLQFMQEFANAVRRLWSVEDKAAKNVKTGPPRFVTRTERQEAIIREASKQKGYADIRAKVARGIPRARRIANRLGLVNVCESYPMPAVGGPVIPVALFDAILFDPTYQGVPRQLIVDALNQTLGACQERVAVELRQLINPIYWVKAVLVFIIRIPFMLIEVSGFDVSKVEGHLSGMLIQIGFVIVLIFILLLLGRSWEEITQAIATLLIP